MSSLPFPPLTLPSSFFTCCTCTNFRGNEKAQFYLSLNPLSFLSPTLSSHPPVTCHPPSCQPSLHPAQLPQSLPQFLPQSLPHLPAPSCRLPQRCGCLRCRSPTAAPVRRCTQLSAFKSSSSSSSSFTDKASPSSSSSSKLATKS